MTLLDAVFSIIVYAKKPEPTIKPVTDNRRVEVIDKRVTALRSYLSRKQSPLMESASTFIRVSDQYGLAWTLLPAIAGVESGFEKAGNTSDHNPFGYMCKKGPCVFDSFDEAIERVGKTIGAGSAYKKFQASGSVSALAVVYNYVSPEDWTSKIIYFQEVIDNE